MLRRVHGLYRALRPINKLSIDFPRRAPFCCLSRAASAARRPGSRASARSHLLTCHLPTVGGAQSARDGSFPPLWPDGAEREREKEEGPLDIIKERERERREKTERGRSINLLYVRVKMQRRV